MCIAVGNHLFVSRAGIYVMPFLLFLAIRIKERKEYMKARQELKDMVEEFYQRFSLTYKQMRLKHRRQLERLKRTETINGKGPANQPNGDWV